MTKRNPSKRKAQCSKNSKSQVKVDDGDGHELRPVYQNITWHSRVSHQDCSHSQTELFEYLHLTQVTLESPSRDTGARNFRPKELYPCEDRHEQYKNDTLGFETLYEKTQHEMDIADLQDEDPLVDLHHRSQSYIFITIAVPAGENRSQAPSKLPTKMNDDDSEEHGNSHLGASKNN